MDGVFTILGSGNSSGVPALGNDWGKCDPDEPKNKRTRPCAFVQVGDTKVLIDMGPDVSDQMTSINEREVDAILMSHSHGDHTNGIDDIRAIYFRRERTPIPVYGDRDCLDDLFVRFPYVFGHAKNDFYKAYLDLTEITPTQMGQGMNIGDVSFVPFVQDHGTCSSLGFRFGNMAYSTDMLTLDDAAIDVLQGVDVWIADGAAYKTPNPVHATLDAVYSLNERVQAKQVFITHLPRNMDYATLVLELPNGYAPAYDGLQIAFHYR